MLNHLVRTTRRVFITSRAQPLRPFSIGQDWTLPKNEDERKRRLMYRCKQRGLLELDMLLGTWARDNIDNLNTAQLDELEKIVDVENPDLQNYMLQHEPVPVELDTPIMRELQGYVRSTRKNFTVSTGNQ